MSVMRRKIAEHMVMSKRVSPHVHSAFEIDFTKVDEIRKRRKVNTGGRGQAHLHVVHHQPPAKALKDVPIVNAASTGTDVDL